ncbi:hypothetical protein [Paenibacillus gansuensis]|uniref:Import inner membrane translocase subunit Tim44 n=1 Tax=Paenibacillus gansuensis TaxID=306542 RepID=A0ABW5PD78_9BACL
MKKVMLLLMAFTLMFTWVSADYADAKPRFKSPRSSYTPAPKKDSTYRSDTGTKKPNSGVNTTAPKRGFFSGGSLMKGLMIGGLAGLLFGGLFAGMGFLGNIVGLLINIFAIYLLFIAIRGIIRMVTGRKRYNPNDPYNRDRDDRNRRY